MSRLANNRHPSSPPHTLAAGTTRGATPVRAFGLALLLALLTNCSLIVDYAESDGVLNDGAPGADRDPLAPDAGPPGDAAQIAFCGPELGDTLGYYSFEEVIGTDIPNSVNGGPVASSLLFADEALEAAAFSGADGPEGCGTAAKFTEGEDKIIQVSNAAIGAVKSVDLWIRIDDVSAPLPQFGVLSKDQNGPHNGDVQLTLFVDQGRYYFVMRLQRETKDGSPQNGTYLLCSPEVSTETWHHVALSADGAEALLFVNGKSATENVALNQSYGASVACNVDTNNAEAFKTNYFENTHNWFLGASTGRAPDPLVQYHFPGAIDEVRFRSVGFTLAEASLVYGSGRADGTP